MVKKMTNSASSQPSFPMAAKKSPVLQPQENLEGSDRIKLLEAQWYIITKTLDKVLGTTSLYDVLLKELAAALNQNKETAAERKSQPDLQYPLPGMVYRSAAMHDLAFQIHRIRDSKMPVLITGESGTGKEGIARAIHTLSQREQGIFVAFNCTVVTKDLISSQLFGHRKGSFTGAEANTLGSIRSAEGGTIFLDEIGDLPLELQPKLLRFLQESEVHPVGEAKPVKVDVRVVAATNRDLEVMVEKGLFREDLYYRLNVLRFHLPPLRERREEIPLLAYFLLEKYAQEAGKEHLSMASDALAALTSAEWPGNIRQLANEIQRSIAIVGNGEAIEPKHLSHFVSSEFKKRGKNDWLDEILSNAPDASKQAALAAPVRQKLSEGVQELEKQMIVVALFRAEFNLSKTARDLGLTRRGLYLKLDRYHIDPKELKKAKAQDAKPA
jgi:hydrogenase-4 transcriptional activator